MTNGAIAVLSTAATVAVASSPVSPVVETTAASTTTAAAATTTAAPASSLPPDEKHEEALPRYKRDLVAKIKILRTELQTMQPQSGHCRLEVSRAEIFEVS